MNNINNDDMAFNKKTGQSNNRTNAGPPLLPERDEEGNNMDDEEDEVLEDVLQDRDDFHEIEMEDDFMNADDDDHLPDDDLQ